MTARRACEHYSPESDLCGEEVTRLFITGPRCQLHAPGADDLACQHRVAWFEHCDRCARMWPAT